MEKAQGKFINILKGKGCYVKDANSLEKWETEHRELQQM